MCGRKPGGSKVREVLASKRKELEQWLLKETKKDCAVAFSGGVDSALLLKMTCDAAKRNKTMVYAVTMQTVLHPAAEITHAKKVAEEIGAKHLVIPVDELKEAGIDQNPVDRCYRCKKLLFTRLKEKVTKCGVSTILEGTNAEDLNGYRPGFRAVQELEIKSPLMEAGFNKEEVRKLSAEAGLSVSNRPSLPCLATRFPYGTALSYEEMRKAERGEAYLRGLGFYNVRLRIYGDLVRIEVDPEAFFMMEEQRAEVVGMLKTLGYRYITLDLEGFRSGSMDIGIGSAYNENVVKKEQEQEEERC